MLTKCQAGFKSNIMTVIKHSDVKIKVFLRFSGFIVHVFPHPIVLVLSMNSYTYIVVSSLNL